MGKTTRGFRPAYKAWPDPSSNIINYYIILILVKCDLKYVSGIESVFHTSQEAELSQTFCPNSTNVNNSGMKTYWKIFKIEGIYQLKHSSKIARPILMMLSGSISLIQAMVIEACMSLKFLPKNDLIFFDNVN